MYIKLNVIADTYQHKYGRFCISFGKQPGLVIKDRYIDPDIEGYGKDHICLRGKLNYKIMYIRVGFLETLNFNMYINCRICISN